MSSKLLIIGAGGHGHVVAEVAEDCGYTDIAFIDDNSDVAVGKITDIITFKDKYQSAFVGIGNNKVRDKILRNLKKWGFEIPTLIHPSAYISRTAVVCEGTIVEPKAIVNANSRIGKGSIISVGAIVDHDVEIGKCCHVNSGAIVKAGGKLDDFIKLEAGEVVFGYESAVVKRN